MSATTEALELVKLLKPKIGEQAAVKLIDFSEKRRDKGIDHLWIAIGISVTLMLGGFAWLASEIKDTRIELKAEMKEIRSDVKDIRADIKELRKLILQKK